MNNDEFMQVQTVVGEIHGERVRQFTDEGYTHEHDDTHDFGDWWGYIRYQEYQARDATDWPTRRRHLIKAAALLAAQVESGDRIALATATGANALFDQTYPDWKEQQ